MKILDVFGKGKKSKNQKDDINNVADSSPEYQLPYFMDDDKKKKSRKAEVKKASALKNESPASTKNESKNDEKAIISKEKKPVEKKAEAPKSKKKEPTAKKAEAPKAEENKPAAKKAEATKTEEKKPAAKKAEAPKAEEKKPAAKKAEATKAEEKKPAAKKDNAKKSENKKPEIKIDDESNELNDAELEVVESKSQKNGKFEIKKSKDGRFVFNLYASNNVIVATSQVYSSSTSAVNGINSVIANAATSPVEDQTLKNYTALPYPKWEIYRDKGDQFRFRLSASNGSCVCHSQGYTSKANCKNGIDSIIKFAAGADIEKSYLEKKDK